MATNPWSLPTGLSTAEKKAVTAVFESLRKMNRTLSPSMRNALAAGNVGVFLDLVDVSSLVDLAEYKNILTDMARKAGIEVFKPMGGVSGDLAFNLIDQKAVEWAEQRSSQLIVNITDELRETIQQTVAESTAGDFTVDELARRVRRNLPLTPRDSKAVNSFFERNWNRFIEQGSTSRQARAKAEQRANKYAEKLTRGRARTIARTEIASAAQQGRFIGWESAIQEGLIDPDSKKEWIAEPTACKICSPMDGMVILWNGTFPSGGNMAPAHPNCRCSVVILPPDVAETPYTQQADAEYEDPERVKDALELGDDDEAFNEFQSGMEEKYSAQTITEDETYAVVDYTSGSGMYDQVNGNLRGLPTYEMDEYGETQAVIDNIDSAFKKTPPLDTDVIAYRGMSLPNDPFEFITEFEDAGYMSTSHSAETALSFTREYAHKPVLFQVRVPKGTRAMDPSAFKTAGRLQTGANLGISHAGEKELLLNRGGRYKILGKSDYTDDAGRSLPLYEIELMNE